MSAALTLAASDDQPWVIRPYVPEQDDGLMYLLGVSYARSRAGKRAGANFAGREASDKRSRADVDRQMAFMSAHRPIWTWLLAHADVMLAVDREDPVNTILGWLIASGPEVIHAVGVKRSAIEQDFGPEVATDLLGQRLRKHQVCTLELPQMATHAARGEVIGLDRPSQWSLDPTWLLTRMRRAA